MYELMRIKTENSHVNTYTFKGKIDYEPGQFVMLWLPNIDEKPFALSNVDNGSFSITIEEKGNFTKELKRLKPGAKLGIRGPFGNGFTPKYNSIVFTIPLSKFSSIFSFQSYFQASFSQ